MATLWPLARIGDRLNDIEMIPNRTLQTPSGEVLETGRWLGRKHAFAELAGRCSAADAECLRQLRHKKMYRRLKLSWREFCKQHLGISRSAADQTIRRLEEFGRAYFVLAQAAGITENEYRRISSAVHDQKLLRAGEEIPITAENTPQLAAAVEALKQQARPALPAPGSAKSGDGADPAVAKTGVEKQRAEVARDFERAVRHIRSGLDRYRQLSTRRLEPHTRAALVDALHSLAGRAQDLCEDARPH